MNARAVCKGHFSLPMAVEDAKPLFTPEGERRRAGSSWDPIYAIPDAVEDDSAPGTVFTTESDGGMAGRASDAVVGDPGVTVTAVSLDDIPAGR